MSAEDAEVRSVNPYVESIRIGEREIEDLRQQLAAATARAEQAEAACATFRGAITTNRDVPLSLLEGLRSYAATTENAEKAWHDAMVSKIETALSSDAGKSTADELRRLRAAAKRLFDAAYRWHTMEDDVDTKTERHELALEELYLANAEVGLLIGEIAAYKQPARAERSE